MNIKKKSKLLFTDIDSLMYEIKTEDGCKYFSSNKEMFFFSNYSTKSRYYGDSNKLAGIIPSTYVYHRFCSED